MTPISPQLSAANIGASSGIPAWVVALPPSPRRAEFIARLNAASLAIYHDRRLCTLSGTVRDRMAIRAALHVMRGRKGKLWSETSDPEQQGFASGGRLFGEIADRIRAAEQRAIDAAEAAYAAPEHA